MATIVNITGTVNQSVVKATVNAAPGSAGTALAYTAASSLATIVNTSATAAFEYQVNSNGWKYAKPNTGGQEAVNFQTDTLSFRQTSDDLSLTTVEITIDAIPIISALNLKSPNVAADGVTLVTPSGADAQIIPATPVRKRALFIGDSRTQFGQPYRRPGNAATGAFDGRTVYVTSGTFNASTQWIAYGIIDGTAALNSQGIISSDGAGLLSYAHAGDSSGPKVDVSQGGWFYLVSGTNGVGITIAVRGAATKVLNAGGTYATSGFPLVWDFDPRGHISWVAGALGDTFADYQAYAIPGASTADTVKYLPQVFATSAEMAVLECGVNDISDTGSTLAQATAAIANIKLIIDYCSTRVARLYVCDIWQAPNKDATAQRYIEKINTAIRAYCRTKPRTRFVSCANQMVNYSTTVSTSKTGVYFTDNLHLVAYGAYKASLNIIARIRQDYPYDPEYRASLDLWDSALGTGALNPNPSLVGTTGTGSGAGGVTGTVPTSWNMARTGTTQTCVGAIVAATDGGPDWYTMTVTGATSGDYHTLSSSINPFSTGVNAGDYYRVVLDIQFGAMTTPGISTLYVSFSGNTNMNNIVIMQLQPGWNIDTFSTENPSMQLYSEPQKILDATTPHTLRVRVGGAVGGGGTIGVRNFRVEKVPGPIYP